MQTVRFKPKTDKLLYVILLSTLALLVAVTAVTACTEVWLLLLMLPIDVFTLYFIISPLFGFVELREDELYIKFGFFMSRSIPYARIRGLEKRRAICATSMMSLKNAIEHVDIKHNTFDVTTVSVTDNDAFMALVNERARGAINIIIKENSK